MTLELSSAHRAARNQASIDLADAGVGASSIKLYTASGGTLLAVCTLAKPCGAIVPETGRIRLLAGASVDLVLATGIATWATWCDADGTPIAAGTVTAEGEGGDFQIKGAAGTQLYEGGVVPLDSGALIG